MRVNSYGMKYVIKIDASIENGVGIFPTLLRGPRSESKQDLEHRKSLCKLQKSSQSKFCYVFRRFLAIFF